MNEGGLQGVAIKFKFGWIDNADLIMGIRYFLSLGSFEKLYAVDSLKAAPKPINDCFSIFGYIFIILNSSLKKAILYVNLVWYL